VQGVTSDEQAELVALRRRTRLWAVSSSSDSSSGFHAAVATSGWYSARACAGVR
jgi:hypothetical protein